MITESLTSLTESPVTYKKYKAYNESMLPKTVFGFIINSKYDEERLKLKSLYKSKYILHEYTSDGETNQTYIHGIEIEPHEKILHLCNLFTEASPMTVDSYKNILKYNKLTCNNNYRYLRPGLCPIDISHLPVLSKNKHKSDFLYLRSFLENNIDLPWFANWNSFNIFMICPSFSLVSEYK